MSLQLVVGKSYNFETYAPELLGSGFKSAVVTAIMDYNTALKERDITGIHQTVYGYLPSGTPESPSATVYIRLKLPSGTYTVLGYSWIKAETIEEVASATINVAIYGVAAEDTERVRNIIALAGYTDFVVDFNPLVVVEN